MRGRCTFLSEMETFRILVSEWRAGRGDQLGDQSAACQRQEDEQKRHHTLELAAGMPLDTASFKAGGVKSNGRAFTENPLQSRRFRCLVSGGAPIQ